MLEMNPVTINGETFLAITLKLPKTNFMAVTNEVGYIMCGALDVGLILEEELIEDYDELLAFTEEQLKGEGAQSSHRQNSLMCALYHK